MGIRYSVVRSVLRQFVLSRGLSAGCVPPLAALVVRFMMESAVNVLGSRPIRLGCFQVRRLIPGGPRLVQPS